MVALTKNAGVLAAPRRRNNTTSLLELPRTWIKRHDLRKQLAEMDSRMLRDIGWNVHDARREAIKPFWMA